VASDVCVERRRHRVLKWGGISLAAVLLAPVAAAEDYSPELIQPPICSAETAYQPALKGLCEVAPRDDRRSGNKVKINLTANTSRIEVGGYSVVTEHYNDSYVPPVVRANPGDIVAAHLENLLASRIGSDGHCIVHGDQPHGDKCENPTNLHYFHGGIVTPNNSWRADDPSSIDASQGNGDNIYVHLKAGRDVDGKPNSFDFVVPIPGEEELDGRVLEAEPEVKGDPPPKIAHPPGLNWYHSHLHGISSDQVMGGLSGLLSVGDDKANVKACRPDPTDNKKCLQDIDDDTSKLRDRTDVRYVLLRDIALRAIAALPEAANGAGAVWAPEDRDFPPRDSEGEPIEAECRVWNSKSPKGDDDPKLRKGFCQRDKDSAWLFTLNGQRFPTITVEGGRNLLLRMGNLSANVAYWLELECENCKTDKVVSLTLLSVDGVVPARPVTGDQGTIPAATSFYDNLLLMPASRAEIYVRNDSDAHRDTRVYILRTKGLNAGSDQWPEIQLARIELKPNAELSTTVVALNASIAQVVPISPGILAAEPRVAIQPPGCVRDLIPSQGEHRRVTFFPKGRTSGGRPTDWSILTQIVRPPPDATSELPDEGKFKPVEEATVGIKRDGRFLPIPFEEYVKDDGTIDWLKPHVCIFIDDDEHVGSHKQLWVLLNGTEELHNFHIHQMKFRLATWTELSNDHGIMPPNNSEAGCPGEDNNCPRYFLYDDDRKRQSTTTDNMNSQILWHDTIPIPPSSKVFLIMSFDADEQVGRFVFHCHILKHEDKGLMAPIEVWKTQSVGLREK
jgi:FtsP/CotA-like multicopper oxidase with cupredoxin domain